jgi:ribosomal protein L40E
MQLRGLLPFLPFAATLKRISWVLILIIAFSAITSPNVKAQTTSVTILNSPSQIGLGSDGTASFDVTAQVTFSSLSFKNQVEGVVTFLSYFGQTLTPSGSATAAPLNCLAPQYATDFIKPGLADCILDPSPITSGTDTVTFHAILYNANTRTYHFEVAAFVLTISASGEKVGSESWADFWVTLTSAQANTRQPNTQAYNQQQYTQAYTAPTYTQQRSAINIPAIVLWVVAAVALYVLVALFVSTRRGKQPRITEAKKVELKAEKATTSQKFCIECGNELPPKSKFCNNCGTEQP